MVGGPPAYWTWWDEVRKVALDTAGRLSASEGCLALMIWCAVMGWVLFWLAPYIQAGMQTGLADALTRTLR